MGIATQMARFVIREAKYLPIRGAVLLIGRQTVNLTPESFADLMREQEMAIDPGVPVTLDTTTRSGAGKGFVSDTYFFRVLGADSVTAMDVSSYEGAEITHNLNTPVEPSLEGKFDFIFNGSVLDNMFDPVTGLRNISRMLAPNGRVIHFEHASNATNNAYLQFSPNWFFDYCVVNRFADCKAYLAFFRDLDGPWDFYACSHNDGTEPRQFRSACFGMTAIVAEKSALTTWDKSPIQKQYRSPNEQALYMENLKHLSACTRPVINGAKARWRLLPTLATLKSFVPNSIVASRRGYQALGRFG